MLSDPEFRELLLFIDRPWAGYRKVRKSVKKRIRRHMQDLGCRGTEEYLQILARSPEEKRVCEVHLTVIISRFYRDRELWDCIKTRILPDLITNFPAEIHVWCAGCANGEEPYTLAIIRDLLAMETHLHIFASDINADCLQRAQLGIYGRGSIKEVPKEVLTRYFKKLPGQRYEINPALKKRIFWQQHDFFGGNMDKGPFHMIFLRNNLLTYYQGLELERVFLQIVKNLVPGGYLITGAREQLPEGVLPLIRKTACPWIYQLTCSMTGGMSR